MMPRLDEVYVGDAEHVLAAWPARFVDACVTSPPYFRLRDYQVDNQLGREATVEAYIDRLVRILDEVKRVLTPTGSLYLNMGDTYHEKSLLGVPWRVALRLRDAGWVLRSEVIWHKTSGLPSPVKDRFTSTHEHLFLLTVGKRAFFNLDAVRVPYTYLRKGLRSLRRSTVAGNSASVSLVPHRLGKNPGDVWSLSPENRPKRYIAPGPVVHLAPFPESLCERPIRASVPVGGLVLDPFMGSGTTAVVARRLGRRYLGVELSAQYADLTRRRLDFVAAREGATCSPSELAARSVRRTGPQDRNSRESELGFSSVEEAA